MNNTKQILILRKDLHMRTGKAIAQASHASLACILQLMENKGEYRILHLENYSEVKLWLAGSFTKICCYVNSEEELDEIYWNAQKAKLNTVLITDNGLTEFHGVPTKTCVGIGPDFDYKIDEITKHLKLL